MLSYALQYPQHSSRLILCNTEACLYEAQIEIYTKKGGKLAGDVIRKIYESSDQELCGDYIRYCAPHLATHIGLCGLLSFRDVQGVLLGAWC